MRPICSDQHISASTGIDDPAMLRWVRCKVTKAARDGNYQKARSHLTSFMPVLKVHGTPTVHFRPRFWCWESLQLTFPDGWKDKPGLGYAAAIRGRCSLRPSSPTRRFQRAVLAGQLSLFNPIDPVVQIDGDNEPAIPTPSLGYCPPAPAMSSEFANRTPRTRTRQSGKRKLPATASLPLDGKVLVSRKGLRRCSPPASAKWIT
jgi:hypothetical protein